MLTQSQIEKHEPHVLIYERNTLHEVQRIFNECFHFLRLEFYYPDDASAVIREKYKTLHEYGAQTNSPFLRVGPEMRVSEVICHFTRMFGLPVKIYRKKGKQWLNTMENWHWTLEEHDVVGKWNQPELKYSVMV